MKNLITIFLVSFGISSNCFSASIPRYVISSECITSIEVQEMKHTTEWALLIKLNDSSANQMLSFSKKYIGKKVRMIDGQEKRIIKNDIRILSYLSSPFQITGLSSEEEAINAKMSILKTDGKCGEK